MIEGIVDWLEHIILTVGYPGVFFTVALESFFAPIPSEALMPFVGYMAYQGELNVYITIILTALGGFVGTLPFYVIGYLGKEPFERFLRKYGKYLFISDKGIDKVFEMFDEHGNKIIFFGRLIPTIRTLVSFPAGVAKMNFGVFTLYSIAGSLVWSTALILIGYLLGDQWQTAIEWISAYEKIVMIILGIGLLVYIGYFVYKEISKKKLRD
jgi:membrane protein DedA with SNARE-associated domain